MKKKKVQSRKTIQNRMDKAWSLAVKIAAGHKCEKCGREPYYKDIIWKKGPKKGQKGRILVQLNSHHIIRRSIKAIRWSLGNGLCLCPGCHTRLAHSESYMDQLEYHQWLNIYWITNRLDKYGTLNEMVKIATEKGRKDLPMAEIRMVDEALKKLVDSFK